MFVRALTPADAESFQSLRLSALQLSPSSFASTYDDEKNRSLDEIAARLILTEKQAVFGAFDEEHLVGIAGVRCNVFRAHEHQAHLWGVYVAPGCRGAGVSRRLLAEAIGFAHEMAGVTQLHLTVASDNAVAIQLYQSLGFDTLTCEPDSIFSDCARDDDVLMCLRLTSEAD
ncbi:GNAT family N-acetyltransferase (plasmid) [Caballeronia sp. NK8]|uniref:GNAT family N-acetyltransferase n=1 Tax=Caballeronia sp. NK8 TaxID=140098 RepID=UPI001BB7A837|nr:GNAT family N-acetyltransferase [Caballeronia sp. NK8]BCQ28312.1 GNAT family N-acetyltransferase [Caballeronia sp. NK8]